MPDPNRYLTCPQCGWLGLCAVACPLPDPSRIVPADISTKLELDLDPDRPFEVILEDAGADSDPQAD